MDINVTIVSGNLTADPTVRTTDDGKVIGRFRIASQRPRNSEGDDGGADFIDVTVFGAQATNCARYLAKGRKVLVKGHLHHSEWDSADGRRQRLEINADPLGVQFLGGRQAEDDDSDGSAEPAAELAA
jgi:single-strand DNA-binding protein